MELRPLYLVALGVGTTLGLLLALSVVERTLARDLREGNPAERLLRVGQVLAVFMIGASAVHSSAEGQAWIHDVPWVGGFALLGLVLVLVTGRIGVRLLLDKRLSAEIARGNVASGVAAGAHFVATGIVTSRALGGGDLRSLLLSLAFFGLAQLTLIVFVSLFRTLTTYDDEEQIAGENLAAALSYGGVAIAIAIVVARALEGDFVGWVVSLKGYGGVLLSALALYPVRQIFVQTLLLRAPLTARGGRLDEGIALERSVGLGALEGVTYIATALSIARLA